ncbi:unnamed protein product [Paramecium octaurelia]|uniref:Uncharacterized protein n=1 Tax=Paramecium octaurelia TaxID=43137 RepID=A0A8S1XH91_PAROT|nr:unnamed protein product [Paramecium octaurelia]
MNLEQFISTEDDWAHQSYHENDDFEFSCSPIMFGRPSNKNKNEFELDKEDYFIDAPKLEEQTDEPDFNQLLNTPSVPIKKRQIRKNRKLKNNSIATLYKRILSEIINDSSSQAEIQKQLEHCQRMKSLIDGLEKTLVNVKSLLVHKLKQKNQ